MSIKINKKKRGRPEYEDATLKKSKNTTICLSPATHNKLSKVAIKNNRKVAEMARQLIEDSME